MKKRLLIALAILTIVAMSVAAFGYLSDKETSNGNTFTAGSIDLKIDGADTNVVKFTAANLQPDAQLLGVWELKNTGTLPGYVNIKKITVIDEENGIMEPESEAGDTTADKGELSSLMDIALFSSADNSPWYGDGDKRIFTGFCSDMGSAYNGMNILLQPGEKVYIVAQVNWHSQGDRDSTGMSDSMQINFEFRITQKAQ